MFSDWMILTICDEEGFVDRQGNETDDDHYDDINKEYIHKYSWASVGREWEREMRENISGHNEKGTFRINLEQDEQKMYFR